jgi:signal transduction histidine kinase
MHVDDLRPLTIFEGLSDQQLADLVRRGAEVRISPGDEPFREGEPAESWWVLVDGALDLYRHVGREDTMVARMDVPGRWAGGFRAWDEQAVYLATGRVVRDGRLLRVPADALRELTRAWFPLGEHLVEGLFRTARSIESTARQRGALVTLGTLAAGLAHEINNPAAAATRAVDALESSTRTMLAALTRLAQDDITATQFTELDALRREVGAQPGDTDPLARADREQEVSTWLADHGVGEAWTIGAALAGGGADVAWCERVAGVLDGSGLEPGLGWVAGAVTTTALLAEVKESTRRIAELVGAVRSYSQMDRASVQQVDLAEGLESTLVILGHKLHGVRVQRDYDRQLPKVEAHAGELNQVWTNLIDNAADAMEGDGTLRVVTRSDGDHVVVEIRDTGPGMPAEVVARAFEAFFTTKEVGRGTGLGLDIARRIVHERHAGSIDIESTPSGTVVRVRLPVRLAAVAR